MRLILQQMRVEPHEAPCAIFLAPARAIYVPGIVCARQRQGAAAALHPHLRHHPQHHLGPVVRMARQRGIAAPPADMPLDKLPDLAFSQKYPAYKVEEPVGHL